MFSSDMRKMAALSVFQLIKWSFNQLREDDAAAAAAAAAPLTSWVQLKRKIFIYFSHQGTESAEMW